jgi:uncharacterized repeat protein (TIGR01451 family)
MSEQRSKLGLWGVWTLRIVLAGIVTSLLPALLQAGPGATPSTLPDVEISVGEVVASGFIHPVQVTHAGDGSNRLFVVEQAGRVLIIEDGAILATPFLDVTSLISDEIHEQGLLGLAFHPDYENNGLFYVNYTRAGDGATVVARGSVSSANPDLADPSSLFELIIVPQPFGTHNGGQLMFSPVDGYLYVGLGDGGAWGDPFNNAQDTDTLLGAMLRLDVDGGGPYAIPLDNPLVAEDGRDEIWAYGLRNPWRFSFDRETGDLYIGDVGQEDWEEIDYQAAGTPGGLNFGWSCKEGAHDFSPVPGCATAGLTDPIAEYSHLHGHSVTGGFVYRGAAYPTLVGRYFYGDFVEGKIWSLYKISADPDGFSEPELELDTSMQISAFGEDESGEVYVVDWGGGVIRRLADASQVAPLLSSSRKAVSSPSANPSEVLTYTLQLINTGRLEDSAITLTDVVPTGLSYVPGSLRASEGAGNDSLQPTLTWQGVLSPSQQFTITYQVVATGEVSGSIVNEALVTGEAILPVRLAASVTVPRSVVETTPEDFLLPGTQPGDLIHEITPSIDCKTCHTEPIYDRWRGSMMSQAGRDPLMWAALAVANVDAPNSGEYCLRCHTGRGWLEGRSHPADGAALEATDVSNGVACALCHRMVDPVPSMMDEAAAIDQGIRAALTDPVPLGYVGSGTLIVDPEDRRRGPFSFDLSLPHHAAYQTDFLRQTGDAVTRARQCGTCHNVDNPVLSWDEDRGQYWPNNWDERAPVFASGLLFPVERTFDEWLNSEYARGGVYAPRFAGSKADGIVRTCQDCHFLRTVGTAALEGLDAVERDCQTTGCLPEHRMVGGNTWVQQLLQDPNWRLNAIEEQQYLNQSAAHAENMLTKAATLSATLTVSGTVPVARVRVVNETGHKLPTGYPEGRQMWLNLKAFDADGRLVYESGAYDEANGRLVRDEQVKVYEVKQGMTPELAAELNKAPGESFHFVLNNTVVKDNRIPPRGYQVERFDRDGLRPVGADFADEQHWDDTEYEVPLETEHVIVTLYYQTASREYVEFLHKQGGVDGQALESLWAQSKGEPVPMVKVIEPANHVYLPVVYKGR